MFKKNRPTTEEVLSSVRERIQTEGLPDGPPQLRQFQKPSRLEEIRDAVIWNVSFIGMFLFLCCFRTICWFVGFTALNYIASLDLSTAETVACAAFVSIFNIIGDLMSKRRNLKD